MSYTRFKCGNYIALCGNNIVEVSAHDIEEATHKASVWFSTNDVHVAKVPECVGVLS